MELISKEEWIIRLMQGMVGDYGAHTDRNDECYYHGGRFYIDRESEQETRYLDLNDCHPTSDFWITKEKGVPRNELNIINIKEK